MVETLNHLICSWVVCSCMYPFGSKTIGKGSEEGGIKLCTLVKCNSGGVTKVRDSMSTKSTSNSFGSDIGDMYGFGPTGETINAGECCIYNLI